MMLGDFLLAAAKSNGQWHCSTLAADWCIVLGYPDFAAQWRHVSEPSECERHPYEAGGLVNLWDQGIGSSLPLASKPYLAGDIGVVARCGIEAGAIYTGERWALQNADGLTSLALPDAAVRKAWRP
jgi:hypothetical protein